MYKVIWLVKFRKDLEQAEVLRWWRGRHAQLAAATPGMVRYVQSHWTAPLDPETRMARPGEEPRFDGHAEHWFESEETYRIAMASEEWRLTSEDGPAGFDSVTLVGGELDEYVVTWEPADDGRLCGSEPLA